MMNTKEAMGGIWSKGHGIESDLLLEVVASFLSWLDIEPIDHIVYA